MAQITAADLLVGSDEDFVINLYLAFLGRWPELEGYRHLLAKIAGSEAARAQAIADISVSAEAMARGLRVPVPEPLLPPEPLLALQRQLSLRTQFLLGLIEAQQAAVQDGMGGLKPSFDAMQAELEALRRELREGLAAATPGSRRDEVDALLRDVRAEMATLRRELRERQAEGVVPPADSAMDMADYVNDLLAVADARMEMRLRMLEKRLP